jgi:hypothetical protein
MMRWSGAIKLRIADAAVLLLVLVWVAASYAFFWGNGGTPEGLIIESPAGRQEIRDLTRKQIIGIAGRLGESRIEIREGQARFIESPCRGKLCIHAGWLTQAGDVAACLPNGIVIALQGADHRYDSINY